MTIKKKMSFTCLRSSLSFLRRLELFLKKGPVYHYTYGSWRLRRLLNSFKSEKDWLDDELFFSRCDLNGHNLEDVRTAVNNKDFAAAKRAMSTYFHQRKMPRFFFDETEVEQLISFIDEDQKFKTIRSADKICHNIFDFRSVPPIEFKDEIDWFFCPKNNKAWMWDLNRHSYFETLGRAYRYTNEKRYARKFADLLRDWIKKNPPGPKSPNWFNVFEVSFRINCWIWALYYFRSPRVLSDETLISLLKGLLTHGRYLYANLEYHVQNNHLLLEAKSLAFLGLLFTEFRDAQKWVKTGLNVLFQQIESQVYPDGVHSELSTLYHRIIVGELLEIAILFDRLGISPPNQFTEAFEQMIEFELWVSKPNGTFPLFGDSSTEDTYLRFSGSRGGPCFLERNDLKTIAPPLDETTKWVLGVERVLQCQGLSEKTDKLSSRGFPHGGYFIMRNGNKLDSNYLVFDCGPFGHKPVPSHGHADALSFELYALGATFFVDPGVYGGNSGLVEWRNYFRGTRSHNTVVVDGKDQSVLIGKDKVYRTAKTKLHRWITSDLFDLVDASHDGYERLSDPVNHRRLIFFVKPEYWVIVDYLSGNGRHDFDVFFHLMPGITVNFDKNNRAFEAVHSSGVCLAILPIPDCSWEPSIIQGQTNPIQGWVSLFSGEKVQAPTICYHQSTTTPALFAAILYPYRSADYPRPKVSQLSLSLKKNDLVSSSNLLGLKIETSDHIDHFVLDVETNSYQKYFAGFESDGDIIYIRKPKESTIPSKVFMKGGQRLRFHEQSLLTHAEIKKDLYLDGN
jgi:uncharacterized heparinase superfamily protein